MQAMGKSTEGSSVLNSVSFEKSVIGRFKKKKEGNKGRMCMESIKRRSRI